MLNSIIRSSQRPAIRNSCLNGGICITVFFLTISILSCFFLLLMLAGVVWASIYLCAAAILSSLYVNWLKRSPQQRHMIPISIPFVTAQEEAGLDASAITALPSFQYQRYCTDGSNESTDGNGWVQCAICIGTVQVGEMVRNLPACKHLFHVECIDLWLSSHSTCPMCRSTVVPANETEPPV